MSDFNSPKNSKEDWDFTKGFGDYMPDSFKDYSEGAKSNFDRQSGLVGEIDAVAQATDPQAHLDQLKSTRESAKERTQKFMTNSKEAAKGKNDK